MRHLIKIIKIWRAYRKYGTSMRNKDVAIPLMVRMTPAAQQAYVDYILKPSFKSYRRLWPFMAKPESWEAGRLPVELKLPL